MSLLLTNILYSPFTVSLHTKGYKVFEPVASNKLRELLSFDFHSLGTSNATSSSNKAPGGLETSKFYLIKNFKGNSVTGIRTPLGLGEKGFNGEKCLLTIRSYDLL
jgi:hypothetical protein